MTPAFRRARAFPWTGRSATAALEFGLVAPLFMMLTVGILTFGLYFGSLIAVTNAAAEGARASVAGLSDAERGSLASQAAKTTFASYAPFLMQNYMTVSTQADPANAQRFQVSVTYDFASFDILKFSALVPVPMQKPTITMSVADAGYY
jgi:Flp pilus assembly protein TadG